MTSEGFRIAAVQAAPVFLNLEKSIDKACRLIQESAKEGASLAVFPEAFLPGYPLWVWFIPPSKTQPLRELYNELHANSVSIPGTVVDRLAEVAGDCKIALAMGVNERNSEGSNTSLYNTLLYLGADGRLLARHRKMIPTAAERLVWAQSPGVDLEVLDMGFARVSGLICWENYMPLARYMLSAEGHQIHVAPTWDRGEPWISSMRHIGKETRCFVAGVCQALHRNDIPDHFAFKNEFLADTAEWLNPGKSLITDPDGKIVAGPLDSEEGILYADIEQHQLVGPRWQLDIAGHYARPDVFDLHVCREERPFLRSEYSEKKAIRHDNEREGE